jgi:1A family penicillin-binding protein
VSRRKKSKQNVTPAKLAKTGLKNIQRLLAFIGKPFYFLLSYSFISIVLSFILTKFILKQLPTALAKLSKSLVILTSVSKRKKQTSQLLHKIKTRLRPPKKAKRKKKPLLQIPSLSKIKKLIQNSKLLTFILVTTFLVGLIFAFIFWHFILKDLPSPTELTNRNVEVSTKIYDRNGILLYNIYKDKNRSLVKLENIPLHVRLATLAIEDAEFYFHPGFSVRGISRAIVKNIKKGELAGGSTITQQLVKNALLTSEKTLVRKLKELTLAILVELTYTKDEILEMYLNEVSYGGCAYGIQEASRMYFDKNVNELTLAEAALLAGLPKSPTNFSPFGPNPDLAKQRQAEVLRLMQINKYLSEEQKVEAQKQKLTFAKNKIDIKAPHFVMYVRQILEGKYSKELVEKGGLKVITTLDWRIQNLAEEIVRNEVENLKNLNVTNGAVVVVNPETGEVLAMVGSVDYFDTASDGNVNVTTRPRQPGSSIKIVNYAYALSNKFTPATIINDSPVTFLVEGQPPYTPRNYEGGFRGNLTLRSVLAESRNIPAVKVLSSYGVDKMIEMGQKMGITTWENPENYGLSLTLGGGEVKLIDLARAYATIANYGKGPELVSILEIKSHDEKIFEGKLHETEQVLDPRVAFILTDILRDNIARSPAFGTNSLLVIPNHPEVAVKTGTSNNLRDNLTIGYNQDYVVAVWVGNNDNSQMSRIASGITGATPIFNKIMSALLTKGGQSLPAQAGRQWKIPEGLVQLPICPYTGTLACTGCPIKMEWFLEENKPEKACSPEWFKKTKVEQVDSFDKTQDKQVGQVGQENRGEILPEAARMEVVDLRQQKHNQ